LCVCAALIYCARTEPDGMANAFASLWGVVA